MVNQMDKQGAKMARYYKLEKMWRKLAFITMPLAMVLNILINCVGLGSPRDIDAFNYPELVLESMLIVLGFYSIIRSVKTVMLFTCLAYFSFGLMFAYEEVLKETRDVMWKAPLNYKDPFHPDAPVAMLDLEATYSPSEYVFRMLGKYGR